MSSRSLPMSGSVSSYSNYECLNSRMQDIAPILASQYAKYPMEFSLWLSPWSQTDESKPTFMPQNKAPKEPPHIGDKRFLDYCWGEGSRGTGYYHLLTKDAYVILIQDLENAAPSLACGCMTSRNNKNLSDLHNYMEIMELLKHRVNSDVPNDFEIANKINDIGIMNPVPLKVALSSKTVSTISSNDDQLKKAKGITPMKTLSERGKTTTVKVRRKDSRSSINIKKS
ncbi:hypothetical protein CTEN210_16924 [Chaetoceros tenuissimus]|uniref:Uncharacterized protein n=1 Tax=Chaetoceros tenuissimus TaxID=426638 RepID=A0AAD3D9W4_9STRA|nr:hypothetical protein CTEN210_16924 [Chaetoceros tenuissimus]